MDMKRFFLYAIAIAALALAGCGGNGGGGTTAMMPDDGNGGTTTPMPMTCDAGYSMVDGACVKDTPTPSANNSFPGSDMEAAMAIFLPLKDGSAGALNDPRRPGLAADLITFEAGGDSGVTTIDGDVLNKPEPGIKDAEEFDRVTDATRDALDGFYSSVDTRTMETDTGDMETDTVTIYSNVMDRGNKKYLEYFAETNKPDNAVDRQPQHRPNVVGTLGTGDTAGVLTLGDIVATSEAGLFMADAFPSGDTQTYEYEDDDKGTPDTDEAARGGRKFEGTFNGVAGMYSCTGDTGTCSAKTRKDGSLSALDGDWIFTPDTTGVVVRNVIPDADFLSFGYWVQATEKDGETTYGVSAFYGGSQVFNRADITTLMGTATYEGEATGLYVKKTFSSTANDFVPSASGQFTADAGLTAYFGGNDVAESNQYRIKGTVTNFMDGDEMIDPKWTVTLGRSTNTYGAGSSDPFMGPTTTQKNGGSPGTWEGQFYGDHVATTPPTDADKQYPNGVAGKFNAHFSQGGGQDPGHVIGGFGATLQ